MPIRGILLDKDGTLIDLDGTWVPVYFTFLEQAMGLAPQAAQAKMEGAGFDPATGRFRPSSLLAGGTTRQIVEAWWPSAGSSEHDRLAHMIDVECAPMARTHLKPLLPLCLTLESLRDYGFVLGIGTNDSHFSAMSQLAHLGVGHLFTAVIGADLVERPKPSGDMVRRFAGLTGLQPSEIAMVGDTLHDMHEARNGGAGLAIGVLSGSSSREQFEGTADFVVKDIGELHLALGPVPHVL